MHGITACCASEEYIDTEVSGAEKYIQRNVADTQVKKSRHFGLLRGKNNRRKSAAARGSLTVEAAMAVPLFFFSVVTLICLMDLYSQIALRTVDLMQKAEKTGVIWGMTGASEEQIIDLQNPVVYKTKWFPESRGVVLAACRGRVRAWTGRKVEDRETTAPSEGDRLVYVTEHGTVYHTSAACSHLNLGIKSTTAEAAANKRNYSGHKYYACEKCMKHAEANGTVYLTEYGEKYHCSPDCSGLTRTVRMVPQAELGNMRECRDCAAHRSYGG